jgi:S-adenosylmethionine decarboxylase
MGVSGVAVLAESHISIHTWPERDYAALDIFMCGDTQPEKCIEVLREAFETDQIETTTLLRGQIRQADGVAP